MRTRFPLVASLAVLAAAGTVWLAACDSSTAPASTEASVDARTATAAPAIGSTPAAKPAGLYRGAVVVRTVDHRRVVVSLDARDASGETDGQVDRIFTLQTREALPAALSLDATDATVRLVHGNLFVDRPAGRGLHLRTDGYALSDERGAAALRRAGTAEIVAGLDRDAARREVVGVGLAQQIVDAEDRFALARARDAAEYTPVTRSSCAASRPFRALGGSPAAERTNCSNRNCPAGGPGSTGCGANGCDVTCADGYYACCDGTSCKCCG